jgi:hypothetical protein
MSGCEPSEVIDVSCHAQQRKAEAKNEKTQPPPENPKKITVTLSPDVEATKCEYQRLLQRKLELDKAQASINSELATVNADLTVCKKNLQMVVENVIQSVLPACTVSFHMS